MSRLFLGTVMALIGAAILTTSTVSGQGRVDSPGVMTREGGVPALGSYKVPKTPWGEPDLQGTYNANDLQGIPMQRQQSAGTRYRLNDEEYKQRVAQRDQNVANDNSDEFTLERAEEFEKRFGTVGGAVSPPPHWLERARTVSRVTSYVIDPPDGRIPALTPAAQAAGQQRQQAQLARRQQLNGIEAEWTTDRSNYDRCISTGVINSITPKIYNSGSRIVQGPGWLAFQNEMIHETRVIPTDGRKQVGASVKNWMGTSVGHWEGDVLVVETRNIKPESAVNGQPLSDEGVLIERFTLADANTLDYRVTVNDPKVYVAPWTARLPIPREEDYGYYEYACHEGNYAMPNLLAGSRAEEKRRAEAAARGEKVPEPAAPARGRGAGAGGGGGGRGGRGQN
ncbi:MAG TPA: hypothetical protein VFV95_17165 [Vicinamibacterales bacterium]|nr:hypothetical protein [Vicinamibacterales bacterium]